VSHQVTNNKAATEPEVFHLAPVSLAILDADLRYVYCNHLLAEMCGTPAFDIQCPAWVKAAVGP